MTSTSDSNEMNNRYEALRLGSQLCFPLYAVSKEVIRRYKPFLDQLDLTYTQYIAMMVLWEHKEVNVKELGELLYLDSGTLTPVLKKLETKGYVTRTRSKLDERNLIVAVTEEGMALRERAINIPDEMSVCMGLSTEEFDVLYDAVYHLLDTLSSDRRNTSH